MPLRSQLIDIPFSGGLDSQTDAQLVSPPSLLALQNAVFTKGGTLQKRNGYQPLGTDILGGGTLSTGQALATFDQELLQITSTGEVYSYSESQDAWMDRGNATPLTIEDTPIIRNSYTQSNPDMDTAFGITVFAWEDTRGGVRATVVDEATGANVLSDISISSGGANPRVVAVGASICVLFAVSSTLSMVTLNAQSPTAFSGVYILDTNMPASGARLDAKPYDGLSLIAAWSYSGQTRVAIILPAGYEGSPLTGYPSPVNVAIASTASVDVIYDGPGALFWIQGASGSGLYGATLTTAFIAGLSPTRISTSTDVSNVTGAVSGDTLTSWYEVTGSETYNSLIRIKNLTTAGAITAPTVLLRSVGLGSKVFSYAGSNYFVANFSSPLQPTAFLVNGSTGNVVGKGPPFLSGGLFTSGVLPKVVAPAGVTGQWSVPAPTRIQLVNTTTSSAGAVTTYTSYFLIGIDRLDFFFNASDCFRSVQVGENLHISGGVLQIYDGQSVTEHGFHFYPEGFAGTPATSGGSMADGAYSITCCWYWQDARGQLFRSAPGVPIIVTISGGSGSGSIALVVPTLRLTSKSGTRTAPILAVFRTPVNGTLMQRVGNGAADPVSAPVYSTTTADTVSFSLTVADATIAANEILYTTGGTLANIEPGSVNLIAASHDRIFLAGAPGLPNTVFYSQFFQPGGPVNFSPNLYVNVNPRGGDITSIATLDTHVVFFKESSIYAMSGDGPDSAGNANQFTLPFLVTSDVGCTLPESICLTPQGLMFKTTKGLYMLDRSLSVSYRGAPADSYNSLNTTSGVLVDGVNEIRFTSDDGVALIFDYFFNLWGTFTNTAGASPTFLANDAVSWSRRSGELATYAYLNTTGTVLLEAPGQYLDTNNPIAVFIRTAWIKLGNLQGFVKIPWVTVLGTFYSQHTLQVGVAYDFQGFTPETRIFDCGLGIAIYGTGTYGVETPYGGVSNTVYQFRFRPNTMKCEAIQFTFTEQSPTDGLGFTLSGMTLQAAMTPAPFRKLSAGQTIAST